MRFVKKLVLQGYKTFASSTEFVFDAGVTAVVGPNGSGKSNIADALRWVLGEQAYSTLRGKRTEDMIFSGSEQRPRLGMASASVTIDNSSGWLPIEFGEVEIARRAYRSGENEYYLNGNRVRLRDITELLSGSGLSERTYSVIGQGLIDEALSQRPEERRRLFEEAAGITVHQSKREQAIQRLNEARANLNRAQDIISELTPRLRYLKGQARRAQEYQQIKSDLDAQLRVWYGFRWRQSHVSLADAEKQAAEMAIAAQQQAEALQVVVDRMSERRHERAQLRDQLSDWHRAAGELHQQAESTQRAMAVRLEQVRLWGEQQAELERELVDLHATIEDIEVRRQAARRALAEAQVVRDERLRQVASAQSDLEAREQQRADQGRRADQAENSLLSLRAQLAEATSRLAQTADRQDELAQVMATEANAAEEAAAQVSEHEAASEALSAELSAARDRLGMLEQQIRDRTGALNSSLEEERRAADALAVAERALQRLQDQHDMLSRLRDEGVGLSAGARTILNARAARALEGVVGALGDLIEVPDSLELAIEAALGGRVQDIVVRRWIDAEAAISLLKQRQGGRATFLPLDALRPGRLLDVPSAPGVIGRASDLVLFDPALRAAVELALGGTLVVEDLATARSLLRSGDSRGGNSRFVTQAGEIVRPSGSVTGGSEANRSDSGMLARSRTLRELEPAIETAGADVAAAQIEVETARARQQEHREAIATLQATRDSLRAQVQALTEAHGKIELADERARQSRRWHDSQRSQATAELERMDARAVELRAAIATITGEVADAERALETARRDLAAFAADDLITQLARLRAEAAVSEGELRSRRSQVEELTGQDATRQRELLQRQERLNQLRRSLADARAAIGQQEATDQELGARLAGLSAQIEPAEARLAELEIEQRAAEGTEQQRRELAHQAQLRQSQADLALQRARDELAHLQGEIEKELGLVALAAPDEEPGSAWDSQPPLPMEDMVTRLPVVNEIPDALEPEVRRLRGQINRLGPVNLDALSEYGEVDARFNFLSTQAEDSERAIESLEVVIAELDRLMEREFLATFRAVSQTFRDEFTNLFGGGSARLVLSEPDSPGTTGIEIIARPPGKREQGLALLSGGERALTAAALIFSILKTRPTPFCVMDEVDASLDEANVGRFRDALHALSEDTQFILITHNRGTIEIADTIYGVSMGPDHTSQVLSLKLDGNEIVPAPAGKAD